MTDHLTRNTFEGDEAVNMLSYFGLESFSCCDNMNLEVDALWETAHPIRVRAIIQCLNCKTTRMQDNMLPPLNEEKQQLAIDAINTAGLQYNPCCDTPHLNINEWSICCIACGNVHAHRNCHENSPVWVSADSLVQ